MTGQSNSVVYFNILVTIVYLIGMLLELAAHSVRLYQAKRLTHQSSWLGFRMCRIRIPTRIKILNISQFLLFTKYWGDQICNVQLLNANTRHHYSHSKWKMLEAAFLFLPRLLRVSPQTDTAIHIPAYNKAKSYVCFILLLSAAVKLLLEPPLALS
jgi:hypothetical protein